MSTVESPQISYKKFILNNTLYTVEAQYVKMKGTKWFYFALIEYMSYARCIFTTKEPWFDSWKQHHGSRWKD
jgi:hypothetical protein